jgi:hypothetical protein
MKRRIAAIALLLSQVTCSDLTLVGPTANAPPVFNITVSVDQQQSSTFRVSGILLSGTDAAGKPTALTDSVLFVNGHAILPTRAKGAPDYLLYGWNALRPGARTQFDTLALIVPAVAGRSGLGALFVTVPARSDSSDIVVPDSADLVLHLSQSTEPSAGFTQLNGSWSVVLTASCTESGPQLLRIEGDGALPPDIRVPRPLLGVTRPDVLSACLHSFRFYVREHDGYHLSLTVAFQTSWRIHKP